jgi:protein involved in ribonucleotide reduction
VINQISTMYFSATDATKKVVCAIGTKLSQNIDKEISINNIDFTLPKAREKAISFTNGDVLIIGVPVYAGRVPNVLLKYLNTITGNGTLAVPVVVYGNRNYDDEDYLRHKHELEVNFTYRREPELFL